MRTVHEPEAELLTAQDAIQDGENLLQWFRQASPKASNPIRGHLFKVGASPNKVTVTQAPK